MKKDSENMIKGAIGEKIVEEMFKELGFFVMHLGKEYTVNPITQMENFVKSCKGEFFLEKLNDEIKEVTHVNVLPDFVIVYPNGKVNLLEVKFRWNGEPGSNDELLFETYPEAHMIVINLRVKDNLIDFSNKKDKEIFESELKSSRFHIWFNEDLTNNDEPISVCSLNKWLKDEFDVQNKEVIEKYEKYVEKWLRKEDLF